MNQSAPLALRRATYADILAAPAHMVAEIIRGDLCLHPRPASRHAHAGAALGVEIGGAFGRRHGDGPGGWVILYEPELHLGDEVLVPDFAGWRRERMPAFPDAAFFTLAPDWVCEILSPGTRTRDLTDKRAIYAEHGVPYLWFVDPLAKTLEAFTLSDGLWTLRAALRDSAEVRVAPFDAIAFPLSALWPEEPEAAPEAPAG
jgi:Uma2 family endonuclease